MEKQMTNIRGVRGTKVLVADEEPWKYVGLCELHNEGKQAPHVSQGKIERALRLQGDMLIVFFFSPQRFVSLQQHAKGSRTNKNKPAHDTLII